MGQQYLQLYGVPGTVNTTIYPYGQLGQAVPSGHGYSAMQGYTVPGHQIVPYGGSNVNAITTSPMPAIQASFPSGIVFKPKEFSFMIQDVPFCCFVNLYFSHAQILYDCKSAAIHIFFLIFFFSSHRN